MQDTNSYLLYLSEADECILFSFTTIVVNGLSEKDSSRHNNRGKAAGDVTDVFEVRSTDNVQTIFRDLKNT